MEIINETILIQIMGSNQTQIPLLCDNTQIEEKITHRQSQLRQFRRHSTSETEESKARVYLDEFKGRLTLEQCCYVMIQLLRQSFEVLQREGRVFICHQICQVSLWGQMQVHCRHTERENGGKDSYFCINLAQITTRIMQIVKELSIQQAWEEFFEKSRIFGKMMKIIYRQHKKSQTQLFKQLMEDVLLFQQANNFSCNLLSAILRVKQSGKDSSFILGNLNTTLSMQSPILDGFRKKKSILSNNYDPISKNNYSKTDTATKYQSNFDEVAKSMGRKYHKVSKTQVHNNCILNTELQNSCIRQQKVTKRQRDTGIKTSKNHISSQYSLNILSAKPKEEADGKLRVRFKESKENMLEGREKEFRLQRTNTAQDFTGKEKRGRFQRSNDAKSVLEELARSVEVVDHPSSKSLIF